MRKGTMMVALAALLVAIFATAAYAANIDCDGGGCFGTSDPDLLNESSGNDQMYGYRGGDVLSAWQYNGDVDKLYGGRGNDDLDADDGDGKDLIVGGRGSDDECEGNVGDEFQSCDGNVTRVGN